MQIQTMEVDEVNTRTVQALVLFLDWLSKRDLCCVSTFNSEYRAAARECHLWQPTLAKLEEMYWHDHIDLSDDHINLSELHIQHRIRGERRDHYSFLPHPRDRCLSIVIGTWCSPQKRLLRLGEKGRFHQ